jgi:hypothetical protein
MIFYVLLNVFLSIFIDQNQYGFLIRMRCSFQIYLRFLLSPHFFILQMIIIYIIKYTNLYNGKTTPDRTVYAQTRFAGLTPDRSPQRLWE